MDSQTYYYYSFGFFRIILYSSKVLPSYLITSPVPTCLVYNRETSRGLLDFHLLLPLFLDQIPFNPHHQERVKYGGGVEAHGHSQ